MKLTKHCLYLLREDGDCESGPHLSVDICGMYDTRAEAEKALAEFPRGPYGTGICEEQIDAEEYAAFQAEQEYIAQFAGEEPEFDEE